MNNNEMMTITDNLLDLFMNIHNKLLNPNQMIKGSNMPLSHMKVIFYLAKKKTMSVSDVAKCLDISKPNMTPIIDKLINEGFVLRYTDPKDRRKYNIELTEKGYIFINEKKLEMKSNLTNRLSFLEENDLMRLDSIINNMNEIISKLE
ncbi:MarR family transcriptional regulator [Clostridium sp. AL.422]|uniref:MarR family winged helix-turn-helix transcriptional regulator n=1 Tax=Clostridium TaxID=1485 RepID=UPI00293DECA6|nr:MULTISPECIES: MarR family transcriptional regulator [unclassified Clostridium]MDV4151650.1 MarR family transcriptional regulator [Clostridium sp. AL.422]